MNDNEKRQEKEEPASTAAGVRVALDLRREPPPPFFCPADILGWILLALVAWSFYSIGSRYVKLPDMSWVSQISDWIPPPVSEPLSADKISKGLRRGEIRPQGQLPVETTYRNMSTDVKQKTNKLERNPNYQQKKRWFDLFIKENVAPKKDIERF